MDLHISVFDLRTQTRCCLSDRPQSRLERPPWIAHARRCFHFFFGFGHWRQLTVYRVDLAQAGQRYPGAQQKTDRAHRRILVRQIHHRLRLGMVAAAGNVRRNPTTRHSPAKAPLSSIDRPTG